MTIQFSTPTNIDDLMAWRKEVLNEVFGHAPDESLLLANHDYYTGHISNCKHLAIIAIVDGVEIGCGGVCFEEELPSPDNPTGKCAYLMNVYVRSPWRHKGIGKRIVERLIEESKRKGCSKIYLETSEMARPMYTSLGFTPLDNYLKL